MVRCAVWDFEFRVSVYCLEIRAAGLNNGLALLSELLSKTFLSVGFYFGLSQSEDQGREHVGDMLTTINYPFCVVSLHRVLAEFSSRVRWCVLGGPLYL